MKPYFTNTIYLLLKVGIKLYLFLDKITFKSIRMFQVKLHASDMLCL